jgi:hypothetical protein
MAEGPEPHELAVSIRDTLTDAGWQVLSWNWTGVGAGIGVAICVKPGSPRGIETAAEALVIALNSLGISAGKEVWPGEWTAFGGMFNGPNPPNPTDAPMRIIIATKPQ